MAKEISGGLSVTSMLFVYTIVLSIPLGLILSLCAVSNVKFLTVPTAVYTWLLRGTPLILQVMFVYYGLPAFFNLTFDNLTSATIAFVLNYAAYFCEIFRAGIQSVDTGQYEGARALGLSYSQIMRYVIIPQTARRVLPPVSNETITLVKDTSLVSIIALSDVLHATKIIVMREATVLPFVVAGIFYLVVTLIFTWIFRRLEERYSFIT